jgi:2-oxoglutarate/2-oxoacid ferredoxin oxidoreductase subunit beta
VSGDGDSLSIGLGQFCHAIRRNVNVLYVLENNGVYGLTKGQFSASADVGSRPKRGEPNRQSPIDPALLALSLGATFVARSFSGDKDQLVPILKAGVAHRGFAFVDIISPCVTFNDHEGSTKSYRFAREHIREVVHADLVPLRKEITVSYPEGEGVDVRMHDGSTVRLRKTAPDYDPTDRDAAYSYVRRLQNSGEIATGVLYIGDDAPEMHEVEQTVDQPLVDLPFDELCPGNGELGRIMEMFR